MLDKDDAIRTILNESRGEGPEGMQALAHGLKNRGTFNGVLGYGLPIPKDATPSIYMEAKRQWEGAVSGKTKDITHGGNHWLNVNLMQKRGEKLPGWSVKYPKTAEIGNHTFYVGPHRK